MDQLEQLLTPHIIKDATDLATVSGDQRIKFGESAKEVKPVDVQKEIEGKGPIQSGGVQEIPAK